MATLVERVMAYPYDAYEGEEQIAGDQMSRVLLMYSRGDRNAAWIKNALGLTSGQGDELDEILATMPSALLTVLNAVNRAQWPDKVGTVMCFGAQRNADYDTPAKIRTALGLS